MAKKKKIQETTIENYYDLKVDKVDELVAALKDELPPEKSDDLSMFISDCTGIDEPSSYTKYGRKKEFDPYKVDFLGRIPAWIKAFFVKWWFAGAVCYFVMWGVGLIGLDGIIVSGAVLGLVTEILVNPLLRFMERGSREYDAYMMFPFPFKAYWTFFTNILYYIAVIALVNGLYFGMNELINLINGTQGTIPLGVEPLVFGTFCLIADMALIGIKDLIVYLVKKSRKKEELAGV